MRQRENLRGMLHGNAKNVTFPQLWVKDPVPRSSSDLRPAESLTLICAVDIFKQWKAISSRRHETVMKGVTERSEDEAPPLK